MKKVILFLSIVIYSCSQVIQVENKFVSIPKVLVAIKDSSNSIVLSDTLEWQKISFSPVTDSTVLFLKSDSLIMRKRNQLPFGPVNHIPFIINIKQPTLIKVFTLDSCYIKIENTFDKGSYRLELFDYKRTGGIYGIYFQNEEQIFKDKLLLVK
jgi:hypothetical protein